MIAAAARSLGLSAAAFFVAPDAFDRVRLPAIAHWNGNHFVVVERWSPNEVEIVDPALGRRRLTAAEFRESFAGTVLALAPSAQFVCREAPRSRSLQRAVVGLLRAEWGALVWIFAASLVLQVSALALPILTKVVIDVVLPGRARGLMAPLAAGALVLVLAQASTTALRGLTLASVQARLDSRLMFGFVDHLLRLPVRFFQQRANGDLLMRLSSNAVIREMLTGQLVSVILDGAFVFVYLAILLWRDPAIGLTAAATGGLQIMLILGASSRTRTLMQASLAAQADAQSYLGEVIAAMPTVKASGCEDVAFERWSARFQTDLRLTRERARLSALIEAGMLGLRVIAPLALLLVGMQAILDGTASLGTILALTAIATAFLVPLGSLASTIQRLQLVGASIERIVDVIDHPPEQHRSNVSDAPRLRGGIELRNVGFSYDCNAAPVVRGISLSIQPGEHVALVGASGSGKSTLAMLILGLYEPTEGEVLYDGLPLCELDYPSVRRQFGVVMQEPAIFSGSIRDNLAFMDKNVPFERLTRCAHLAAVDDDITRLPMGYETYLAERGAGLSGGQRQRIALARALARDPRIVLLDEATSHLDAVMELRIHERLRELRCTRIVIAHRLSTVRDADRIVVLENGAIAEAGTHDALMRENGRYAELVGRQGAGVSAYI
jgi:ATP-binding cassette subfamily B protein